ncbi:MAG: 3-isopropylmalate dehydratase large subunit, partial [Chloroflexi bacterium]|nr:3-isopropylmalate dehydratase large subunit [Chloroflexota bacterium]
MGQTVAEKIISQHVGTAVYAGELVGVPVDGEGAIETTARFPIEAFRQMSGEQLWDASKM